MGVKSTKTVLVVCCMFMMEASGVQTPSSMNGESLEVMFDNQFTISKWIMKMILVSH